MKPLHKIKKILNFPSIYAWYFDNILSRIEGKRGATRLDNFLIKLLLETEDQTRHRLEKLEKISSSCEKISEREWDNLIILDACRHDIYEEVTGKNVEYRISCSSVSEEYVENNFSNGEWKDTVYVNGNPYLTDEILENITGRAEVFFEKWDTIENRWDSDLETVPPEAIKNDALSATNLFPEKRKIIHFMQPHARFIDPETRKARKSSNYEYRIANSLHPDPKNIVDAYKQNLEIVLESVYELLDELEGKTVITSDHGELLGENDVYGHFYDTEALLLRKVPWHVVKKS